jgi:hypothetical protein
MKAPVTGANFHWQSENFPIPVYIHPNMDTERQLGLLVAIDYWNEQVGSDVFVGMIAPLDWPMFEANGFVPVRGYLSVEDGVLGLSSRGLQENGVAVVSLRTGHRELRGEIHSARITIGTHVSDWRESAAILVHELGHSLGLAHDGNDEMSLMYYSATISPDQVLQQEDIEYVRGQVGVSYEFP